MTSTQQTTYNKSEISDDPGDLCPLLAKDITSQQLAALPYSSASTKWQ